MTAGGQSIAWAPGLECGIVRTCVRYEINQELECASLKTDARRIVNIEIVFIFTSAFVLVDGESWGTDLQHCWLTSSRAAGIIDIHCVGARIRRGQSRKG